MMKVMIGTKLYDISKAVGCNTDKKYDMGKMVQYRSHVINKP